MIGNPPGHAQAKEKVGEKKIAILGGRDAVS